MYAIRSKMTAYCLHPEIWKQVVSDSHLWNKTDRSVLHSADSCGYMDNYRELKIRCDPGFGHLQVYQRSDTVYLDRTKYEYRYRLLLSWIGALALILLLAHLLLLFL